MCVRQMRFDDYDGFVEKFRPKKTTDDCYTPPEVYEVVAGWVEEKYGVARSDMVRPFYPGGDYEGYEYPDGCCVVDNPPFSILSRIQGFYLDHGIRFFLFSPTLTNFSGSRVCMRVTHVITNAGIVYENGAEVKTSFVTNMGGDVVAESEPDLTRRLNEVSKRLRKTRKLPVYGYPDEVLTAARLQWMASHGTRFVVRRDDCVRVSKLDANPKGIYGGGLLLSERATAERATAERVAAERAAAERALAYVFELSPQERAIQKTLGKRGGA